MRGSFAIVLRASGHFTVFLAAGKSVCFPGIGLCLALGGVTVVILARDSPSFTVVSASVHRLAVDFCFVPLRWLVRETSTVDFCSFALRARKQA